MKVVEKIIQKQINQSGNWNKLQFACISLSVDYYIHLVFTKVKSLNVSRNMTDAIEETGPGAISSESLPSTGQVLTYPKIWK